MAAPSAAGGERRTAVCRHADADPGRRPHHRQPSGRLRLRHGHRGGGLDHALWRGRCATGQVAVASMGYASPVAGHPPRRDHACRVRKRDGAANSWHGCPGTAVRGAARFRESGSSAVGQPGRCGPGLPGRGGAPVPGRLPDRSAVCLGRRRLGGGAGQDPRDHRRRAAVDRTGQRPARSHLGGFRLHRGRLGRGYSFGAGHPRWRGALGGAA
jgi:hypothetical protein